MRSWKMSWVVGVVATLGCSSSTSPASATDTGSAGPTDAGSDTAIDTGSIDTGGIDSASADVTSADADASHDEAPFVGVWTDQAGSKRTVSCSGKPDSVSDLAGFTSTITSAGPGAIVFKIDITGCTLSETVAGNVANLSPIDQKCAIAPDGSGGVTGETRHTNVLTLTAPKTLTVSSTGTLDNGCTATVAATLTRP